MTAPVTAPGGPSGALAGAAGAVPFDVPAGDVEAVVALALAEDLAGGVDITTQATVPPDHVSEGRLVARRAGVLAGMPVAAAVFRRLLGGAGSVEIVRADGQRVSPGDVCLLVRGPTRAILTAERTALNLACHLSGVATLTARFVAGVAGTGARIRDTRKTMPGLRALEKYAVRCGGGVNHRRSLADQALIKDNHIVAAGGIAPALAAVRRLAPDITCEVECDTVAQVREAVAAGAHLVLLDNMTPSQLRAAVAVARAGGARTEASGGLSLRRVRAVARTGVDYLSVGALTHSAPALDLALDLFAA